MFNSNFLERNKILIGFFIISSAFFLLYHYYSFSWDFAVYTLNAKYWFGKTDFFEHTRPPLISAIIAGFSPLGWLTAEYLFKIFVSLIFLCSSVKLAKAFKINKELFYVFSLSPYVIGLGLFTGAELLSLSLLELSIAYLIEKKPQSGLFLALACLTRYNFFAFAPLLILNKDLKKIFLSLLLFVIPFIPWFFYGFFTTGNMFTSIADTYALNIKLRGYINDPFNYGNIFLAIGYLLPLVFLGLFSAIHRMKSGVLKDKTTLIVLFTLALTLYQYYKIPIKDVRYIFPLVMPISYFSVIATTKIRKKSKIVFKLLVVSVIILNLTTSTIILIYNVLQNESQERYLAAVEVMEDLGIINCRLFTNEWPRINYVGKTAENYPRENMVQNEIDNGNFILMFKSPKEPIWLKDESFVKQLPTVYENKDFVLFGNLEKCNPEEKPNYTYLQLLNRYMEFTYNETINTEPCFVIFENHRVLEKFCNLVNMRGFVSDGNRNFA